MKKLLYISDCFVDSTVFESQVHTICNEHSKSYDVTLLALCNASEMIKEGLDNTTYRLVKYKKPPKLFIPFMQQVAILTFKYIELFREADVIHCRGHIGSAFAININHKYQLNKKIISDIRGAIPEEIYFKHGFAHSFFSKQASKLEKFIFENSDYFFFVSENMKEYYSEKYHIDSSRNSVFPTIVNERYFFYSAEKRNKFRSLLKLQNKFVYIYVGGIDKWQRLDEIIQTFDNLKNDDLYLLIITTDPSYVNKLLLDLRINSNNILVTTSKYEDVPNYLNASDAGLIIRENNIINHVASPTKVNEYLSCGLKIVDRLDKIGDISYSKKNVKYMPLQSILKQQSEIYNKLGEKNETNS